MQINCNMSYLEYWNIASWGKPMKDMLNVMYLYFIKEEFIFNSMETYIDDGAI